MGQGHMHAGVCVCVYVSEKGGERKRVMEGRENYITRFFTFDFEKLHPTPTHPAVFSH